MKSAGIIFMVPFGGLKIKSRTPYRAWRARTLNGPILPCWLRRVPLQTSHWLIEDELIQMSLRDEKILTLGARAQTLISLLPTFSGHFHRWLSVFESCERWNHPWRGHWDGNDQRARVFWVWLHYAPRNSGVRGSVRANFCWRRLFGQAAREQPSLQSGSGWTRRRVEQRRSSHRIGCQCRKWSREWWRKRCIKQRAMKHGWDGMIFKKDKTTTRPKHFEPRANENICVCRTCEACAVRCTVHTPRHSQWNRYCLEAKLLEKKDYECAIVSQKWLMSLSHLKKFIM